ncbi:MAG: ribosome assembly RNA-binding protein YhbY [Lachnospiraceae bacterium]|nr:ribosome assembly RNA-binding protein YhbY [Lachnospiraceae bacterium]
MTSKQRAHLISLANTLEPVFQIGKAGLSPEVTEAINEAFNNRELIKVSVLKNCFDDPRAMAEMAAGRTNAEVVKVIGKKMILYKMNRENPKIILPK